MTAPYLPPALSTPIINPAVGSVGNPPISYISNSEFTFAPTAVAGNQLYPGNTASKNAQSLADTIARASAWCDDICFGEDPSGKGASLAASLSVQSAMVRVKGGQLRLICDYRPIVEVVGIATGSNPGTVRGLTSTLAGMSWVQRRTIVVPVGSVTTLFRTGTSGAQMPAAVPPNSLWAVWSYVNGYPHTKLASAVTAAATSCVVTATDGKGGLWGVFAATSTNGFPGTQLTVVDQGKTERIFVTAIAKNTPSTGKTTLTTSAFANAHTIPSSPDFVPVTGIPQDVHQAVISLTTALIKVRGARALVMSNMPGGKPSQQALVQAGGLEDYQYALKILSDGGYRIRMKSVGQY